MEDDGRHINFQMGGEQNVYDGTIWENPQIYPPTGKRKKIFKFLDSDNTFILKDNQYKIENNRLYFATICKDIKKCGKPTKKVPYYPMGSPYYGCPYFYRGCEEINWTYKYYYNVPILGWYEKNKKTYILCKSGFKAVLETNTKFPQLKKLK